MTTTTKFTVHASVNGWTRPTGILEDTKEAALKAAESSSMCSEPCEGFWAVEAELVNGEFNDISDPIH